MKTHEKIRFLRKERQWTQEDMAEKLGMSVQGYAKIEQGKTSLTGKLEHIAQIFEMDLFELIAYREAKISINNSLNNSLNTDKNSHTFIAIGSPEVNGELQRLQLIITHQAEMITKLEKENQLLTEINEMLKVK